MSSLLERKLIVVTGKGGAGKTTVAAALGLLAARRGLRTIVAELGSQRRLVELFGREQPPDTGVETKLTKDLWSTSIDADEAMIEWLRAFGGRISARMLAGSDTFRYFAAAAPGAKELVSLAKLRQLCDRSQRSWPDRDGDTPQRYDLVVLDAPASGHALAMLRSPQTFAAIARFGSLADQALLVRDLLEDERRSGFLAVALPTEMATSETLELGQGLYRHLGRELDAVIVNATVPRRFTGEELALVAAAAREGSRPDGDAAREGSRSDGDTAILSSAAKAARTVHERARVQQAQVARLRRQRDSGPSPRIVLAPLLFTRELDLEGIERIAERLERKGLLGEAPP